MDENLKKVRSYYYEFFSLPFIFSEESRNFELFKSQLKFLSTSPLSEEDALNFANLDGFDFAKFKEEQNAILFDFSFSNLPMGVSFYTEGRDEGSAKAIITKILRKTDFRRDENSGESEDSVHFVFAMMARILRTDKSGYEFLSSELFLSIINEIVDEFIWIMKNHKRADFFRSLAGILENFMSLERSFFGAKKPSEKYIAREAMEKKPYISKIKDEELLKQD